MTSLALRSISTKKLQAMREYATDGQLADQLNEELRLRTQPQDKAQLIIGILGDDYLFASNEEIRAGLRSRGYDPVTLKRAEKVAA